MALTRRAAVLGALAGALGLSGCAADRDASPPTEAATDVPTESSRPTPPASPTPTPTAVDPLPAGIVNALVFGTDGRDEHSFSGNSDAVMLAQLSADRTRLTLVSIARDTFIRGGKLSGAYPLGGIDGLKTSVSEAFGGLPIHLTAHTNFPGLISITRWMNGIRVINRHASETVVQSTGRVVEFPEGELLLENTDALIYSRQRYGLPLGDLDRAERHRAVITGLIKGLQLANRTAPRRFAELAGNLADRCRISGLERADVPQLAEPLMRIDTDRIVSLMLPLSGFDTVDGQSVNIIHTGRAAELAAGLAVGDVSDYVQRYGTDYAPAA